jgi:GH18 family chitinase
MTGFKKILSFGGWDFSTSPQTYHFFRLGVSSSNRQGFANNVVQFLKDNNLDGLDFDWEYPGEPDIDGIPQGTKEDADGCLEFLKLVKQKLPQGKTLPIALPASFWHLKQFPVEAIGKVVDYVIYMT